MEQLGDPTGAGNSCDTADDPVGCIFTLRTLVLDATEDEVNAAVADVEQTFTGTGVLEATHIDFAGLDVAAVTGAPEVEDEEEVEEDDEEEDDEEDVEVGDDAEIVSECVIIEATTTSSCTVIVTTMTPAAGVVTETAAPVEEEEEEEEEEVVDEEPTPTEGNLQAFTGALGGLAPPVVSSAAERPFEVNGNNFNDLNSAIIRSCDIQNNVCFNAVNGGNAVDFSTSDCQAQLVACKAQEVVEAEEEEEEVEEVVDEEPTPTVDGNLQAFTGALGGLAPAVVSSAAERPFEVNGANFNDLTSAIVRSCDIQKNVCFNAVNGGNAADFSTADCETQLVACKALNNNQRRKVALNALRQKKRSVLPYRRNAVAKRQELDFGSCSDPSIIFAVGLDGRTEESFAPNNKGDFNQGSAQRIGIVANFICARLSSPCDAPADVQAACTAASEAAQAATQDQTAADTFNAALGLDGGAAAPEVTEAPQVEDDEDLAEPVVMTITQCS